MLTDYLRFIELKDFVTVERGDDTYSGAISSYETIRFMEESTKTLYVSGYGIKLYTKSDRCCFNLVILVVCTEFEMLHHLYFSFVILFFFQLFYYLLERVQNVSKAMQVMIC